MTMKITIAIARVLLGVSFCIFGLNGFLHFLKAPIPSGLAGQFASAMFGSSFYFLVFGVQFIAGALLLASRYVALAIVLLGAVIANILMFHISMQPAGIGPGLIVFALWCFVAYQYRFSLRPLFVSADASKQ